MDGDEHVAVFIRENPWARDAQKSIGGRGLNIWFWLVLEKDDPFPDGVLLVWKKGSRNAEDKIGELRLGGGAMTTFRGVHPTGKEYAIENGGNIPVIHYRDIKCPDVWEVEPSRALEEELLAKELAAQLGRDAKSIREENRHRFLSRGEEPPDWESCSLDLEKLRHKRIRGHFIQAQCPACSDAGQDEKGNHLHVRKSGAFGCVIHPHDREHNRRVLELVGKPLWERMEVEQERLRREDDEIMEMMAAGAGSIRESANSAPEHSTGQGPKQQSGSGEADRAEQRGDSKKNAAASAALHVDCPSAWFRAEFPEVFKVWGDAVTQVTDRQGVSRITGFNEDFFAEAMGGTGSDNPVVFSAEENAFRQYKDGVYARTTEAEVANRVSGLFRECAWAMAACDKLDLSKLTSKKQPVLQSIVARAKGRLAAPKDFLLDGSMECLACANGVLRLSDLELLPFSPDLPLRGKLAVARGRTSGIGEELQAK